MSLLVVGFKARQAAQMEGIAKMFSLIFPSTVSTVGTLYSIVNNTTGKYCSAVFTSVVTI